MALSVVALREVNTGQGLYGWQLCLARARTAFYLHGPPPAAGGLGAWLLARVSCCSASTYVFLAFPASTREIRVLCREDVQSPKGNPVPFQRLGLIGV
jgi:hypothetical protein